MRTTAILAILAAAVACGPCGCGPIDVSITTSEGDGSDPTTGEPVTIGSTGLGASESGEPATSTSTGSTSTGEGSSSGSGEGMSTGSESTETGSPLDGTTGESSCAVVLIGGAERCACDGVPADPSECGCAWDATGACSCDGVVYPDDVCAAPSCVVVVVNPSVIECQCGGETDDPVNCGCTYTPPASCECGGQDWPYSTCCPGNFPC